MNTLYNFVQWLLSDFWIRILFMCIGTIIIMKTIFYHTEYATNKKINYKKTIGKIISFNGAQTTLIRLYCGNKYTYEYTLKNKTYQKNCISEKTYNQNDEIEILYDKDYPEESITKEQYDKHPLKQIIPLYIFSIMLLIMLVIYYI